MIDILHIIAITIGAILCAAGVEVWVRQRAARLKSREMDRARELILNAPDKNDLVASVEYWSRIALGTAGSESTYWTRRPPKPVPPPPARKQTIEVVIVDDGRYGGRGETPTFVPYAGGSGTSNRVEHEFFDQTFAKGSAGAASRDEADV